MLQNFRQGLKSALRGVKRTPGLTIAVVLTLAVGIGANGAVFTVFNGVVLRPLGDTQSESAVHLIGTRDGVEVNAFSYPNLADIMRESGTLSAVAMRDEWRPSANLDRPTRVQGAIVTDRYFEVFGAIPLLGRFFAPDDDPEMVVISAKFWERALNADRAAVGRTVEFSGASFTVVGVVDPNFTDPWGDTDVWVPMPDAYAAADRQSVFLQAVGRLAVGATQSFAQAEMDAIATGLEGQYPETNAGLGIDLVTMKERVVGPVRPIIVVFLAAVAFVLLIGCANVANLMLSKGVSRRREFALRVALGAGPRRLIGELMAESVVLSLVAGAGGLFLAIGLTDVLLRVGAADIPRSADVRVDGAVMLFLLGVSLAAGVLMGLAPALQAAKTNLSDLINAGGRTSTDRVGVRLRAALVVAEVALAFVLLNGAGLLMRSLHNLQSIDHGLAVEQVLTFSLSLPGATYPDDVAVNEFRRDLTTGLNSVPGVMNVGLINILPLLRRQQGFAFSIDGEPSAPVGQEPSVQGRLISFGYFEAAGIALESGRRFDARDRDDTGPVTVINASLARRFPTDPIGKFLTVYGVTHEVIGVVADVRQVDLASEARPALYTVDVQGRNARPWMTRSLSVLVRTAVDPLTITNVVRGKVSSIDPALPLDDIQAFERVVQSHVAGPRFRTLLLAVFAAVAVALAGIGIAGVMAHSVSQRVREIGVRVALGARRTTVIKLVLGQSLRTTLLGVAIGLVIALPTMRILSAFLFGLTPVDVPTILAVAAAFPLVAGVASYLPAMRAARVSPTDAMRAD
jgi:predicted permease